MTSATTKPPSTELILVRHGQAHANVNPMIAGMAGDQGLTERGHEQARLLRDRLEREEFHADVLYASTLPRAQQTAAYVSEAVGLAVTDDDELHEMRVGEADGMSIEQWTERWPGLLDGPWLKPYQLFATGAESWATFLARAGSALVALAERHVGETVLAVTHGGVIEASFAMVFGIGPTATHVGFAPENTGLTHWRYDPDPAHPTWRLVTFNDTAHLTAHLG